MRKVCPQIITKKENEGKKWQKKWPNCQMGMLSDFPNWPNDEAQTQPSTCQIKIKFQMDIYLSAGTRQIPNGNSSERNENKLSKREWKPRHKARESQNFCNIN